MDTNAFGAIHKESRETTVFVQIYGEDAVGKPKRKKNKLEHAPLT